MRRLSTACCLLLCAAGSVTLSLDAAATVEDWVRTAAREQQLGRYEQAASILRTAVRSLPPGHPSAAGILTRLGMAYTDLGRYREAENVYRRAVRLARARRAEARPVLATALNNLGALYAETGKLAVARQRLAESLRIHEQIASPSSELFPVLTHLADVLLQLGKPREASRLHDRALAACEKAHGRNAWQTGVVLNNIASLRFREKRYQEAAEVQQSAIEILTLQLGAEHPKVAEAMANLAAVRLQLGDLDEADRQVRKALESLYATHPEDHPRIADLLLTQSRVLAAQGNKKKSREVRRQANAILNQSRDENLLDHTVDVSAFQ